MIQIRFSSPHLNVAVLFRCQLYDSWRKVGTCTHVKMLRKNHEPTTSSKLCTCIKNSIKLTTTPYLSFKLLFVYITLST